MSRLDNQIISTIRDMRRIFRQATGPRLRRRYVRENKISDATAWRYRLSADDIIANPVPSRVVGQIGRAKVFCKCVLDAGLDCFVVCAADYYDWVDAASGGDNFIHGRLLFAVNVDGRLRAFDPFCGPCPIWYDAAVRPGNFIKPLRFSLPFLICAIVPCDEFLKCDSYDKMRNLFAGGKIDACEFTVRPEI
ncbi:hypothetical protein HDR66_01800 [bacterium]|nr:hypothetical protein [bacterium]